MMASIEKQTIFRIKSKRPREITIVFNKGGWCYKLKRLWDLKTSKDRYLFNLKDDSNYSYFECDELKAKEILNLLSHCSRWHKEAEIILNPLKIKPKPRFSLWSKIKSLFYGR